MEKGKMSAAVRTAGCRKQTVDRVTLTVALLLHKSQFAGSPVCR